MNVHTQNGTYQFCATQEINIVSHIASVCMKQDANDRVHAVTSGTDLKFKARKYGTCYDCHQAK
jgi:hypothetical protein